MLKSKGNQAKFYDGHEPRIYHAKQKVALSRFRWVHGWMNEKFRVDRDTIIRNYSITVEY